MNENGYRVVFDGELQRGQSVSAVAGRLSAAFGRDRSYFEELLGGPVCIVRQNCPAAEAQQIAEAFTRAGARVHIEAPQEDEPEANSAQVSFSARPTVAPTFGQRLGLLRAAAVISVLLGLSALGLMVLAAGWLSLLLAYPTIRDLPFPQLVLPFYGLVCVFGLGFIAAVVKPFFVRVPRSVAQIDLERKNEPDLFEFVGYICERLRVPPPRRITVDMMPTVSTDLKPGSRLVLGLPVFAALSTAQLGGVIAAALTLHVGGISGRLARYVVRVNRILYAAVHERDAIDRFLARKTTERGILAGLANAVVRVMNFSRRILASVLKESIGTSATAMRALEHHADRHMAYVLGAQHLRVTLNATRVLRFAGERADSEIRKLWNEGNRVPANLAHFIAARARACAKPELLSRVLTIAERSQEPVAGFHVPDEERIQNAGGTGAGPVLHCKKPAALLLHAYWLLARRTTLMHYRNKMELPITPEALELPGGAESAALDAISGGAFSPLMPVLPAAYIQRYVAAGVTAAALTKLKWAQATAATQTREDLNRYDAVERQLSSVLGQEILHRARTTPRLFGARQGQQALEAVQMQCRSLEAELDVAFGALVRHGENMAKRMGGALALLAGPEAAARLRGVEALNTQAGRLVESLARIEAVMPELRELRTHMGLLEILLSIPGSMAPPLLQDRIDEEEAEVKRHVTSLRIALRSIRDPMAQGAGRSLFDRIQPAFSATTQRMAALDEADVMVDGIFEHKHSMLARLAALSLSVEQAFGISSPAREIA